MLIVMKPGATPADIDRVIKVIETLGLRGHAMPGENRTAIGITGNRGAVDPAHLKICRESPSDPRYKTVQAHFKRAPARKIGDKSRKRFHWRSGTSYDRGPVCGRKCRSGL